MKAIFLPKFLTKIKRNLVNTLIGVSTYFFTHLLNKIKKNSSYSLLIFPEQYYICLLFLINSYH